MPLPPLGSAVSPAEPLAAARAWAGYLGGEVLLAPSMASARELVLAALAASGARRIDLLPTSPDDLVDAVRAVADPPGFLPIDRELRPRQPADGLAWTRVLPGFDPGTLRETVLELAGVLPEAGALARLPRGCVAAIWDLALSPDPATRGAVVGFPPASSGGPLADLPGRTWPGSGVDGGRALEQLNRWRALAALQRAALERTWTGLREAAGLRVPRMATLAGAGGLPGWVPVWVPSEVDPATFFAYVAREGTQVRWLPLERPVHFRVARVAGPGVARRVAERLARWVLIPVGPREPEADAVQGVLGVVKAAEYLGVRWRTEPARAAAYAALLREWYGAEHDAYRPVFTVPDAVGAAYWR